MRQRLGERGTSLVVVMGITAFLGAALFLSLMRTEAGYRMAMDRYLGGVALDLAENGIHYEKRMIREGRMAGEESPRTVHIGRFAHYEGSFETFSRVIKDNVYEIVSEGKLLDRFGRVKSSIHIEARMKSGPEGTWSTIEWSEGFGP